MSRGEWVRRGLGVMVVADADCAGGAGNRESEGSN